MGVWLYPVSSAGAYRFEDANGNERPTSYDGVVGAIAARAFPSRAWWPCRQNAAHVEPGDEIFLYTGEDDIGIFAAGRIVGAEREDGAWLVGWRLDAARTRRLIARPVPAPKVRRHVHPRVTVRDFTAGAKALRESLA